MKTTIAQRKKAAGWITSDVRQALVNKGKLRPGNKDGQKCLCCKHLNGNYDRCTLHDIPTGIKAYCTSFAAIRCPKHDTGGGPCYCPGSIYAETQADQVKLVEYVLNQQQYHLNKSAGELIAGFEAQKK